MFEYDRHIERYRVLKEARDALWAGLPEDQEDLSKEDDAEVDRLSAEANDELGSAIRLLISPLWVGRTDLSETAPRVCPACGAYAHEFLDACLSCGQEVGAIKPPGDVQIGNFAGGTLEAKAVDMARQLMGRPVSLDTVVQTLVNYLGHDIPMRPVEPYDYRAGFEGTSELYADMVSSVARLFDFRYYGGLAALPSESDVGLGAVATDLVVSAGREAVARIPAHEVLAVWSFPDEVPQSNMRWGFVTSNLIYLPNPTYRGGGLAMVTSRFGSAGMALFGNRTGWFARKQSLETFRQLAELIASWAAWGAKLRMAEVGMREYVEELGGPRNVPQPEPEGTKQKPSLDTDRGSTRPSQGVSLVDRLAQLHEANAAGLISDEEAASRKKEILDEV